MPVRLAKIVQISDLHLNRKSDGRIQDMAIQIIGNEAPDLLIVSGDVANQPFPWQMKRAARFVRDALKACADKPKLLVIAGNHDYKFFGNVGLRRLTRVPFEVYFRQGGLDMEFLKRLRLYLKLSMNALWPWGKSLKDGLIIEERLKDNGLFLIGVNSNSLAEMMAAGRVEASDLRELYRVVGERTGDGFPFLFKIAVVHHHPAPIADTADDFAGRIEESFMVFYNAGTFLRELNRRGFDLVLHGHKHFAGFVRVAHDFPGETRTELAIAAAGSATHNHPDDPRGNHLHVIELYDDGTSKLSSRFFKADVESTEATRSYQVATLDHVYRRRWNAFREAQGFSVRRIAKTSRITANGFTDVEIQLLGYAVHREGGVHDYPFSYVAAAPAYLRNFDLLRTPATPPLLTLEPRNQLLLVDGIIRFPSVRTRQDSPIDFGVRFRLMNAHTLTPAEFTRHYAKQAEKWEAVTHFCHLAADLLTLEVEFPEGYQMEATALVAHVEYLQGPLKGTKDADLDCGQLREHESESARARQSLEAAGRFARLTIERPIPGFAYSIRWFPREGTVPEIPRLICGRAGLVQKRLLEMAGKGEVAAVRNHVSEFEKKFATAAGHRGGLDVSFVVFDQAGRTLRIAGANFGSLPALMNAPFAAGEGCAGFAFEKKRVVLYSSQLDEDGYFIAPEERESCRGVWLQPAVLLCFPWVEKEFVVGVISVSTDNEGSELLRLFDLDEAEQQKQIRSLQKETDRLGSNLFKLGLEESGNHDQQAADGI